MHKCLDTWLQQGIIRPLQSPYTSQVVIVQKETGEIQLFMDCHRLNSITVRDAFPLPRIDEALQAIHSINWFSSFDLAQRYFQLAMEENDIKKTAFRAGSTGLYKFTHMPFGLSNADSSFCHLMEQCLRESAICHPYCCTWMIFASSPLPLMRCWTISSWCLTGLKNSILKLSLKSASSLALVCYSWVMYYWPRAFLSTQRK